MITFEAIKFANDSIRTTDIKGKEYAEVNQRIKAFRMVHPMGAIHTEIVSLENGVCVIKASISDENLNLLAVGHAYEKEGSTFINKTSYIENCETSAVGRALGMCGFGIDTSVASADEVKNAIHQQENPKLATKEQIEKLNKLVDDIPAMLNYFKVKKIEDLTEEQANETIKRKRINTDTYAGTVDIITGIEDFESQVEYNDEWHTYRLNGKIIPSVTQLLDDGSYENVDPKILKYAQEKGTLVHKEIEQYLKTKIKGYTDEFCEFLRLFNENEELFVQKAIFDVKTSTVLNKKKTLEQMKMYNVGIEYLTGDRCDKYYAIHLPKNKKGKIVELEG